MKLNITVDGKAYEVDVEVQDEDHGRSLGGYIPPHPQSSSAALPSAPAAATPVANGARGPVAGVNEAKVCRSPIAGIVIKINAQIGQQLQANDLLLVLEAMKMETNVTAPVSGKVKDIFIRPGDGVTVNQVLVEFE
ncbi:biotin/lipoyl attachment [Candidatus Koribacter versatilis Ellin345]|uniref:Biotin/lipoyl attachment n=1 Tax=Koribacter versatilis (strain Ellin345) TaxID=204669 RepID=Q1IM76_KORVE|nr:biotin/lipoyl-containing protein [Candidatus Koribacter versatilis]ABF42024.1 biotin/lipoyl attachment [Candidatus Koribacter versatilis Ellin345]